MVKKKTDETISPMEYLFNRTVAGSVPFNWKLYKLFVDKRYKAKRSQEAVLFLGYLVSWQSILTKSKKLRKGYFYRAQADVTRDTGLTKQSQQKAMDLLRGEGIIKIKEQPGQANHFQVDIDTSLKILDLAQKEYTTGAESGQEPGPEVTTININNNDYNNEKGQGIASKMQPISFYEYLKRYKIEPDEQQPVKIIEYFLQRHAQAVGPGKHKKLKPETWAEQVWTIRSGDGVLDNLEYEHLEVMIDHYFEKAMAGKYQSNCDFSIVHFNNPGIKEVNFYESCY